MQGYFATKMGFCSVPGCSNSSHNSQVSFHRFPLKNAALLKQWVHNIQRKDFIPKGHSRVCGEHFNQDSFVKDRSVYCPSMEPFHGMRLKPDAVPTVFGHKPVKPQRMSTVLRHQRREVRTRYALSVIQLVCTEHWQSSIYKRMCMRNWKFLAESCMCQYNSFML